MQAVVKVPGSCGELVQGTINGENILVSCPVDLFSWVRVELDRQGEIIGPPDKKKACGAVDLTLRYFDARYGARVQVHSQLPNGKGMASSTADVVGACVATARALGRDLNYDEISKLVLAIEPSDGVFLPGIALFDHIDGKRTELWGAPPAMAILAIDTGGEVDTILFNQRHDLSQLNRDKEEQVRQALALVKQGLKLQNAEMIARGSTISSMANQRILHKPLLSEILSIGLRYKALGVNIAHSGTMIGLLFSEIKDIAEALSALRQQFPQLAGWYRLKLIGGGFAESYEKELIIDGLG